MGVLLSWIFLYFKINHFSNLRNFYGAASGQNFMSFTCGSKRKCRINSSFNNDKLK